MIPLKVSMTKVQTGRLWPKHVQWYNAVEGEIRSYFHDFNIAIDSGKTKKHEVHISVALLEALHTRTSPFYYNLGQREVLTSLHAARRYCDLWEKDPSNHALSDALP